VDHYTAIQWLVYWPVIGGLLHLVQRGGAWVSCGTAQSPPCCAQCKSPPGPSTASVPTSYYSMRQLPFRSKGLMWLKWQVFRYCGQLEMRQTCQPMNSSVLDNGRASTMTGAGRRVPVCRSTTFDTYTFSELGLCWLFPSATIATTRKR